MAAPNCSWLAPMMAILRDHVRAAEAGEKVGHFSMYFGNRKKADEYLYEAEMEDCEKKYDWFKLHTAFSRDDLNLTKRFTFKTW